MTKKPNKATEPTTTVVTNRAPSSTARGSPGRGLNVGQNRMRVSVLIVFLVGSALSVLGTEKSRVAEEVARIKNADVDFQGEYPGIVEYISGASAEVITIGGGAIPFLYEALKDPNRYVAAHVLLTHLVLKTWKLNSKDWNHLVIDSFGPASDQTVKDQRIAIDRFWAAQRNLKKDANQSPQPAAPSGRG
jgi:hypothetical protein